MAAPKIKQCVGKDVQMFLGEEGFNDVLCNKVMNFKAESILRMK